MLCLMVSPGPWFACGATLCLVAPAHTRRLLQDRRHAPVAAAPTKIDASDLSFPLQHLRMAR